MTRRELREAVLQMLFETEFRRDELPEDIFMISAENREYGPAEQNEIRKIYFDVLANKELIDGLINECSSGWKTTRITRLSLSIMRLCVYEMLFRDDIPAAVSLNEAVELSKTFDEPKAKPFINGVLNGVKNKLEAGKKPEGSEQ
jgi:N utilization substance protein B